MIKVRCVSPHGGCHNGMYHDGTPVVPVWDAGDQARGIEGGWRLPEMPPEKLRLPPSPGGWVDVPSLGAGRYVAVGSVIDVDEKTFTAHLGDGAHFELVQEAAPAPAAKAEE